MMDVGASFTIARLFCQCNPLQDADSSLLGVGAPHLVGSIGECPTMRFTRSFQQIGAIGNLA